jgi:imidazole glycerol-phosphate synthase subunit HisH
LLDSNLKKMTILIIDYEMGNLHSVYKKLSKLGANPLISSKSEDIEKANKIILPGVGNFKKAINNLKKLNLIEPLNKAVLIDKKPILGICLGLQLMAYESEEGNVKGLGWIDATVKKFNIKDNLKFKVPHTGWNSIKILNSNSLMKNIEDNSNFYFVHSYHLSINDERIALNETNYEYNFISAIKKDNIYGVQYHPEKSHDDGLTLLNNFIKI